MSFKEFNILPELIQALEKEKIHNPTAVQKKAIPEILTGKNLLVQSETGTGKTLAFLLPLLSKIDLNINNNQILVLAPTHELVMQTKNTASSLLAHTALPIRVQPLMGNVSVRRQVENLKLKPQLIVGSPGRIADLLVQKKIKGHTIKTIVFDEADNLFTREKQHTLNAILNAVQKDIQVLFFSASYVDASLAYIKTVCPELEKIIIQDSGVLKTNIEHQYILVRDVRDKFKVLVNTLKEQKPDKAIIFIGANADAIVLSRRLMSAGYASSILHGDQKKEVRKAAIERFRQGKKPFLVASDMAARGLDIQDVTHIYNMHLPRDNKTYLHRAGRTGRAGKNGLCVTLAAKEEVKFLKEWEKKLGIVFQNTENLSKKEVPPAKKQ